MSKGTKKTKNRKLRRQIRKTVGALFMISAITIAAIPVQDVSANPEDLTTPVKVAVVNPHSIEPIASATDPYQSTIPYAQDRTGTEGAAEQIVYTSGDGTFQFVYMRPTVSDPNKVAVILGYNAGVRQDSSLTIPETLEAYRKFTDNTSRSGYCLVSKNDSFLYYESNEQKKSPITGGLMFQVPGLTDQSTSLPLEVDEYNINIKLNENNEKAYFNKEDSGEVDESGSPIMIEVEYKLVPIMTTVYYPCYYEQRSSWQDVPDTDLFYYDEPNDKYIQAQNNNDYWKINADVSYIGGEKIRDDGNGGWVLDGFITQPDEGVFANQSNITNLTVGSNILGISDYAFYGCSTLQSVSLANGLQTIGNGAFANCIRLENCDIASNANIQAIGKDAFYNCRTLSIFSSPVGLRALGDSCFEGCTNLTSVDLSSGGGAVALDKLGDYLFKDCNKLPAVEFPDTYRESNLSINMFDGCSSLQYVKIPNAEINFVETSDEELAGTGFKEFKNTVPESFYFEGPDKSNIHITASTYSIAFKYLGQELYELIKEEEGTGGTGENGDVKVTYQVNNNNELVKFWIEPGGNPENVTIPETIGPYGISAIGAGSFNDNCSLKKITIPASVIGVGDGAFKGCHNLDTIIFTDATTMQTIGNDAFKTQEVTCNDQGAVEADKNPKLTFVGALYNPATGQDTVPFVYAMNGVSNINNGNQEKSWITCHSGWPTNIEVKYKYDPVAATGEAELQNYPKYTDDLKNADTWLDTLPYITTANKTEYLKMVQDAIDKYEDYQSGTSPTQPTENEMAIVNSALNLVIPQSVDRIKTGIFSGLDAEGNAVTDGGYQNKEVQSVILNGVKEIEPYTFAGCTDLKGTDVIGPELIGDYAFDDCTGLESITLGTNLTDTGKRPFKGCDKLNIINCLDSDFSYNNGVLYRHTGEGTEIVQCLEGRGGIIGSYSVGPEELGGVTSLKQEAFADCDKIGKVDLSGSGIVVIPEGAFKNTTDLNSVVLPDSVKNIEAESFRDSAIRLLTIPGNQAYITPDAFATSEYLQTGDHDKQQTIIFECIEGTTADHYAKQKENWYINPEYGKVFLEHTVYFWDYPNYPDISQKTLFHKVKVKDGEDAVPPTQTPDHPGYQFSRWTDYTNVTRDIDVYPVYGSNIYAVKFLNWDGSVIGEVQYIEEGKSATPPAEDPVREGYTFMGWLGDYHNVTSDMTILPDFRDNSGSESRHKVTFYGFGGKTVLDEQMVDHGDKARAPIPPVVKGYKFIGWAPSDFSNVVSDMTIVASYEKDNGSGGGSGSGSGNDPSKPTATPTATPGPTPGVKKYTVSVSGGSGSGSYAAGEIVALNAYFLGDGQSFDKWTTSTAGVGFANPNASSTTFTMPSANVAITATYKAGGSTGNTGGNPPTNTGGSTGGGSTSSGSNGGSSVEITKPGIPNTGLAGATVSGATDNFIVKVTEDQNATDAVVGALQARYGDISRIKYLPMDISLYDSTGRTKIADTSGISVNLTLPIPEDLVQYAGNNRVAAVSGGALEDLNARFTTVDGVPCINFTAGHFSPYVIYVDTANLTAGTIDATPKTGDPIHPKWFLALGMACISLILFFKRDKSVIRTKAV